MNSDISNKYKLVRVDVDNHSWVKPIDDNGREYGGILMSFENTDDNYYYAIYENTGDDERECWEEAMYFEQDLAKAIEEYHNLAKPTIKYELTVLLRQDCDRNAERDRIHHKIMTLCGRVIKDEDDGAKRLTYPINGEEYADYRYFSVRLVNGDAPKLSAWLNKQDNVLRYLLVQDDDRKD